MDAISQHLEFFLALLALILFFVWLFAAGQSGWKGEPDICIKEGDCYCERIRDGAVIKQPANTWSNLAFVLVGLYILWHLGDTRVGTGWTHRNPMEYATFFSIFYGALVIFLGPGSMCFHATMTKWGGWVDNLSMNLYVSFLAAYDVARLTNGGLAVFLILYGLINVTAGVLTWRIEGIGKWVFAGIIVIFVLSELAIGFLPGAPQRHYPGLAAGAAFFLVGFVIWKFSSTGKPLCHPDSLWQGHALWHVLTATTTLFLFLYLGTEH